MDIISTLSKGLDVVDIAWEVKCREEDLEYRSIENERRMIDDARRAVNEKAEQLKVLFRTLRQSNITSGYQWFISANCRFCNGSAYQRRDSRLPRLYTSLFDGCYNCSCSMLRYLLFMI